MGLPGLAAKAYFSEAPAGRALAQRILRFIEGLAPETVKDPHGLHRLQLLARQGPKAMQFMEQSTGMRVPYRQEHAVMDTLRALGRDPEKIPAKDWYKTLKALGFDSVGSMQTANKLPSMKISARSGSKWGVRGPDTPLDFLLGASPDEERQAGKQAYSVLQELFQTKMNELPRRSR